MISMSTVVRLFIVGIQQKAGPVASSTNALSPGLGNNGMRLFLIRHGETVDNVAQVYAGVRDSALTNHGVLQVNRLGQHLAKSGVKLTHIFSSDLLRAFRTAEAIRLAQADQHGPKDTAVLETVQLSILREQDYGYYEGKPFYARNRDSKRSGRDAHLDEHRKDDGFKEPESKESMALRMESFLGQHLLPVLQAYADGESESSASRTSVAVVAHGMILSSLWRCLLRRFPPKSISLGPEVVADGRAVALQYLGAWSNTGYLEIELQRMESDTAVVTPTIVGLSDAAESSISLTETHLLGWTGVIRTINGKEHLRGLKRTGGGVGSAKHEEGQRTIESFFKRQKRN
ncbi:phosphoglycerate mutase-like protein [Xylona heveae TC161]|uniref:Phosphoglycerate mutase-like protein n=1 Tax=Xylona heveae (strain CBS 132557 / TC161) TaxID=1328760 RepID=A0A165A3G3_XYLHT|nr:phosphoglycerate mutase-like protein [Xylona heveae TC161]KZF19899.1 phosphoglycerate mutase-like protein [Xylona heveae TC161]